jgi:HEAT repeat protein
VSIRAGRAVLLMLSYGCSVCACSWGGACDARSSASSTLAVPPSAAVTPAPSAATGIPDAVRRALTSPVVYQRRDAADALGRLGPSAPEAVPLLASLLRDDDKWVLGAMGDSGISALCQGLRDREPSVRTVAAKMLGKMGPNARGAIPAMVAALDSCAGPLDGGDATVALQEAIARIGPAALPALLKAFDSEIGTCVRENARDAIAELGPAALPSVLAIADKNKKHADDVRIIIRMMGGSASERETETIQALGALLSHSGRTTLATESIRCGAAEGLGSFDLAPLAQSALPALRALADQTPACADVARASVQAIERAAATRKAE